MLLSLEARHIHPRAQAQAMCVSHPVLAFAKEPFRTQGTPAFRPASTFRVRDEVNKHAGESAAIQRCQVHKRRNVLDHLTDEQKPAVAKKLNAASLWKTMPLPSWRSTCFIAN